MENEKPKKMQKMFDTLQLKLIGQVNAAQANAKQWQENVNAELLEFKKKYNELHGLLLRKFLVDLEARVRLAEINSITLVKLYVHKFHEMEKKIDPSFDMSFEEFYQRLSHDITVVSAQVTKDLEKEDEMAMAKTEETNQEQSNS
jgi:hypothetical protein